MYRKSTSNIIQEDERPNTFPTRQKQSMSALTTSTRHTGVGGREWEVKKRIRHTDWKEKSRLFLSADGMSV